jgi:hypothetical protein
MFKLRILFSVVVACAFLVASSAKAALVGNGDGLLNVNYINTSANHPGNNTANWLGVWNALDGGAGPTGVVNGRTIQNNNKDVEVKFDYGNNGGNFGGTLNNNTINGDGPGGGAAPVNASNYSIRGQTFIEFIQGGQYTISMGSDDGRQISLTDPGSQGYGGFSARGGQVNGTFNPGDTIVGYSNGTGHNRSYGQFTVNAGDILELDALYYEGGGGDSGEISLARGHTTSFNTTTFNLLQDGAFNGAVALHTELASGVPEPTTVTLAMLGLGGLLMRRRRKNSWNLGRTQRSNIAIKIVYVFVAVVSMSITSKTMGINLTYISSFDTNEDVDGLAYELASGHVFTVSDSNTIFEYQTDGVFVGSVTAAVDDIRGIDILPNGNFLVTSDDSGSRRIVELDSAGAIVAGGIDIDVDAIVDDNNGVVFDTSSGTLFVADEDDDVVRQYSATGTLMTTIDTEAVGVDDTEGIAINPINGNLLIGDDLVVNDTTLFEITTGGLLVSTIDLSLLSNMSSNDLLGLSLVGNRLFAGQGGSNRVDIFTTAPEPATATLAMLGLGGLLMRRKRTA